MNRSEYLTLDTYIKQVRENPHIFCMNECCEKELCGKHKSFIQYPDEEYLLASMKNTPYCPRYENWLDEIMEGDEDE